MIANDVNAAYRQSRWAIALRGLIGILVGVVILARPLHSVATLALVVALWAFFEGVAAVLFGIGLRSTVGHWWLIVLGGIVSILIGAVDLLKYPGLTLKFIVLLTGWWLTLSGVAGVYLAIQERRVGLPFGWTMWWSALALLAGVVTFVNPGGSLLSLMRVLAIFGIVGGLLRLGLAMQGPSLPSEMQRVARHPLRM